MGIATNVLGILKLAAGAARIGRGGSNVDADLTTLESGQTTLGENLTAEAGKVATLQRQVVPLARAVRVMMDASTTERGLLVSGNDRIAFGKSAFTFYIATKPNGLNPTSGQEDFHYLLSNPASSSNADETPLIRFYNAGGDVYVQVYIGVESGGFLSTETLTVDEMNEAAVWTISYTPPSIGVDGSIVIARNYKQFGDAVAVPAGAPYTFTGADILISSHRTTRESSDFYWSAILNRAHSIAEIESVGKNGFTKADIGSPNNRASQVDLVTTWDFTSGQWDKSNITNVTSNTFEASANNGYIRVNFNRQIPYGSQCYLRLKGSVVGFLTIANYGISEVYSTVSGGSFDKIINLGSKTSRNGLNLRLSNSGSTLQIDESSLLIVGVTGLWHAGNAQSDTGQVLEQINGSHGLLPSAGASIDPQPEGLRQVKYTVTWNGDSTAKYLVSNQDILPEGAEIERVTAVIEGTPVDGTLGDSADNDRYCTLEQNTGLIEGSNRLALAERATDGTNRELLWKPSAAFTGTIKFTIHYSVGEQ